jgi:hypothetical protein
MAAPSKDDEISEDYGDESFEAASPEKPAAAPRLAVCVFTVRVDGKAVGTALCDTAVVGGALVVNCYLEERVWVMRWYQGALVLRCARIEGIVVETLYAHFLLNPKA